MCVTIYLELSSGEIPATDVYLRIWDCGGQHVFLNLLPAFLTDRTLFLLMFDARHNLNDPCLYLTHKKGKVTRQVEEEVSTLQLIVQWMATIHATLVKKHSSDGLVKFPRVLPVGTHGDDKDVQARDDIFDPLTSMCADKAFAHILIDGVIVDNTKAGKSQLEDQNFQKIRRIANDFASTNVAIQTPIRWVLFRKVFERYARGKPIVPLQAVKYLSKACLIPDNAFISVLEFYHGLAVFFHYSSIDSLKSKVIANPQWLIVQMAQILAPDENELVKNRHLWELLRQLVEPLYQQVLSTQKELKPQDIVDLLEHFLIVAEIHTTNKHRHPGREYFVPSMLPHCPEKKATSSAQSVAPLHLIFSTNYRPPGFFTRLAAVLSKNPKYQVDSKIYRNEVKFVYGSVDELTITEKKLSVCIQVQRTIPRSDSCPTFISTCHEIFKNLQESFTQVKLWLPGIDVSFAVLCENLCEKCTGKEHFIPLPILPIISSNTILRCQQNIPNVLTADQKFWLNIRQVSVSPK